jgi:uncharacterized protein (TIGR03067 family)
MHGLHSAFLTATLLGAPALKAKPEAPTGEWVLVRLERNGVDNTGPLDAVLKCDESVLIIYIAEGRHKTSVQFHPEGKANAIDLNPQGRDAPGRGIYKIEGDTLTICSNETDAPRPTRFESDTPNRSLMVFKRVGK